MVSGGILELCLLSNIEYHWIGLGRYLEHAPLDEWLYNGGLLQGYVLLLVGRSGFLTLCGTPLECWARDRQAVRTWPEVNTPHESAGLQVGHTWWIAHFFIMPIE